MANFKLPAWQGSDVPDLSKAQLEATRDKYAASLLELRGQLAAHEGAIHALNEMIALADAPAAPAAPVDDAG